MAKDDVVSRKEEFIKKYRALCEKYGYYIESYDTYCGTQVVEIGPYTMWDGMDSFCWDRASWEAEHK